jgi:putative protein-disulfide isomerase
MGRIQRAFYAENRDMTATDEICGVAVEAGLGGTEFRTGFLAPDTRNATFRDILIAKEMRIEGFPTLLATRNGKRYALVTNGYCPIDGLVEAIEAWLVDHQR